MSARTPAPFAAGLLVGIVATGVVVIALREGSPPVFAQSVGPATAGNLTMIPAMSQQNTSDMAWVLSINELGNKHLALYQCANGRALKLVATRDITWDLKVPMMKNEPPTVPDIKREVEKALKEREEELKKQSGGGAKSGN